MRRKELFITCLEFNKTYTGDEPKRQHIATYEINNDNVLFFKNRTRLRDIVIIELIQERESKGFKHFKFLDID